MQRNLAALAAKIKGPRADADAQHPEAAFTGLLMYNYGSLAAPK
jgi:hypothetical protein